MPTRQRKRRRPLDANEKIIPRAGVSPWAPRICRCLYYNKVPHIIRGRSTWQFHKLRDQRIAVAGGTFLELERQVLCNGFDAGFEALAPSKDNTRLGDRERTAIQFSTLSPEELAAVAEIRLHEGEPETDGRLQVGQMAQGFVEETNLDIGIDAEDDATEDYPPRAHTIFANATGFDYIGIGKLLSCPWPPTLLTDYSLINR